MAKVLYIAGWGRSGTTILDQLLGQVEGFHSSGEIHNLWARGLADRRACGCGEVLVECETWSAIFDSGFGGIDAIDPAAAVNAQASIHTRHARSVLRAKRRGNMTKYRYTAYLASLYHGIEATTGARVIVDSSKFPTDAIVASGIADHEVFVLHMVRDPRAVAFSWRRAKAVSDKSSNRGLLPQVGILRSTLVWQWYNAVIGRYVRRAVGDSNYLLVKYEDLAATPEVVLDTIIGLLREQPSSRPVFDGNRVDLRPSHTAGGNPVRFRSGPTDINLDTEWERAMSPLRKWLVTVFASPMLTRMRYSWRA